MSVQNILDVYAQATETDISAGRQWYEAARVECLAHADRLGIDPQRFVWAVAALSPQLKWEWNIRAALAAAAGKWSFPGTYTANIEKAAHILFDLVAWQDWLRGPKVTSFARNIWGDANEVCVDTWAWRIWSDPTDFRAKPPALDNLYDTIADDYRAAAALVGLEPRQLQAITWVTIRRLANGRVVWGQLSLAI